MQKKFILPAAVLSVVFCASSAYSATVEVYGRVDMGLNYTHKSKTGKASTDEFSLISGQNSSSRIGLKGKEDLGNGLKVGFNLDSGFDADSGELKKDRLFNREALLWISGDWGEIGMGRCGVLDSGNGRYGLLDDDVTPFGTGWEDIGDSRFNFLGQHTRTDNVLTYKSPDFAGTTLYFELSPQMEGVIDDENYYSKNEGTNDSNTYFGFGLKYVGQSFTGVLTASYIDIGEPQIPEIDDAYAVTLAGAYDIGKWKFMAGAQYFDSGLLMNQNGVGDQYEDNNGKGWGAYIGTQAKVLSGKVYGMVGYTDAETVEQNPEDIKKWMLALGYEYRLSKTTHCYVGAGFNHEEVGSKETELTQFMTGLVHKF